MWGRPRVRASRTPVGSVYTGRPNPIAAAARTAAGPRATLLALAVLLGAAEDATDRQTWRNPSTEHRAYFTALRGWGYPLSPVEQLVLADADPAGTGESGADAVSTPAEPEINDVGRPADVPVVTEPPLS